MPDRTSRYTQRHFQDLAALLAAEREQNGPSPALSQIITAVTALFAENSANFNRELFGKAARGQVSPTARPRRRKATPGQSETPGWTPPVVIVPAEDVTTDARSADARWQAASTRGAWPVI